MGGEYVEGKTGDFIRIPAAAKMMNLSTGYVREHIKRGVYPFNKIGVRFPKEKTGNTRDSYYIIGPKYEAYKRGEL